MNKVLSVKRVILFLTVGDWNSTAAMMDKMDKIGIADDRTWNTKEAKRRKQKRKLPTLARASLAASASAAIARCSWTGSRTSFLQKIEHGSWHGAKEEEIVILINICFPVKIPPETWNSWIETSTKASEHYSKLCRKKEWFTGRTKHSRKGSKTTKVTYFIRFYSLLSSVAHLHPFLIHSFPLYIKQKMQELFRSFSLHLLMMTLDLKYLFKCNKRGKCIKRRKKMKTFHLRTGNFYTNVLCMYQRLLFWQMVSTRRNRELKVTSKVLIQNWVHRSGSKRDWKGGKRKLILEQETTTHISTRSTLTPHGSESSKR